MDALAVHKLLIVSVKEIVQRVAVHPHKVFEFGKGLAFRAVGKHRQCVVDRHRRDQAALAALVQLQKQLDRGLCDRFMLVIILGGICHLGRWIGHRVVLDEFGFDGFVVGFFSLTVRHAGGKRKHHRCAQEQANDFLEEF